MYNINISTGTNEKMLTDTILQKNPIHTYSQRQSCSDGKKNTGARHPGARHSGGDVIVTNIVFNDQKN